MIDTDFRQNSKDKLYSDNWGREKKKEKKNPIDTQTSSRFKRSHDTAAYVCLHLSLKNLFPLRLKRPIRESDKRIQISTWKKETWNLPKVIRPKKKKEEKKKPSSQKKKRPDEWRTSIFSTKHIWEDKKKRSQATRFKELLSIPLLSPRNHPSNDLI